MRATPGRSHRCSWFPQSQREGRPASPGGEPWPLVGVSPLFGLSTGAPLSKYDSALADRGSKGPSTAGQEHHCQNLTAPLAARRPRASRAGGSLTLARGKSAAPVASQGDEGGAKLSGASPSRGHPWPPSPPRRSRAAGRCQPLVCRVAAALSNFDSALADRGPGPDPRSGRSPAVKI